VNAVTRNETTALSVKPASQVDLSPQTFEQALTFSNYLAESDLVPKDFKGKPGNCLIAMQWGAELGLKPLQALSNIAVINGRAALWGDAVIALARSSAACEHITETDDGFTATCKVKRRGEVEQFRTFSMDDAKAAGLLGKAGPWTQYPKRMRQMRARAFALRDVFPDVLRGMPVAEEVMDTPRDMGAADVVSLWTDEQIKAATDAANKGAKSYVAFWKSLGADVQNKLVKTKEHDEFKDLAQRADADRTVDTPPPAAAPAPAPAADPNTGEIVTTVDDVKKRLNEAKNEDALYVAMDWINAVPETEREQARGELEALFNQRLAAIRGN
jgi:hypothetical protein